MPKYSHLWCKKKVKRVGDPARDARLLQPVLAAIPAADRKGRREAFPHILERGSMCPWRPVRTVGSRIGVLAEEVAEGHQMKEKNWLFAIAPQPILPPCFDAYKPARKRILDSSFPQQVLFFSQELSLSRPLVRIIERSDVQIASTILQFIGEILSCIMRFNLTPLSAPHTCFMWVGGTLGKARFRHFLFRTQSPACRRVVFSYCQSTVYQPRADQGQSERNEHTKHPSTSPKMERSRLLKRVLDGLRRHNTHGIHPGRSCLVEQRLD
ncbi:hypothetical protein BC830DRAFT_840247 [Chytriomyces sp. MP71]|nr:hypothetical protein BC830DRAFT_840247 [Chytriomyces sp. MP71]